MGDEDPFPLGGQLENSDVSDFESGMNGWEFKSWMPPGREASAKIVEGDGFRSKHVLQFDADGRDDDGIIFVQKTYEAESAEPWTTALVSWWFKGPGVIGVTAWPRVVYLGAPKDLARQDTQHTFHWFQGQDGMITCPDCKDWYAHMWRAQFESPLKQLQVCVGWKINWETLRTLYLDDILVRAG